MERQRERALELAREWVLASKAENESTPSGRTTNLPPHRRREQELRVLRDGSSRASQSQSQSQSQTQDSLSRADLCVSSEARVSHDREDDLGDEHDREGDHHNHGQEEPLVVSPALALPLPLAQHQDWTRAQNERQDVVQGHRLVLPQSPEMSKERLEMREDVLSRYFGRASRAAEYRRDSDRSPVARVEKRERTRKSKSKSRGRFVHSWPRVSSQHYSHQSKRQAKGCKAAARLKTRSIRSQARAPRPIRSRG